MLHPKELTTAASRGNIDLVKSIHGRGIDINAEGEDGKTALMLACEKGHEEIVEYFVQSTKLEPPPSMVDNMIDNATEQAKSNNGEPFDEENYRFKSRPSVLRSVKWYIIRKELI